MSRAKTALPTSWRAFDDANVANDYECVIIPQSSSRRRYYEVLTYGVHFGNYQRLDDAKAAIEEIYGPVNWTRVRLPLVEVEHYYYGPTTEFTDPLLVYAADLPRLGATAASTTTVYRGVYLKLEEEDYAGDISSAIVRRVQQGGNDHTYGTRIDNLGVHWTTDKRVAQRFATPMTRYTEAPTLGSDGWGVFVPVVITAEVSSADVVTDEEELRNAMVEGYGWNGIPSDTRLPEQEVLVRPGAQVRVRDIEAVAPRSWAPVVTAWENMEADKVRTFKVDWKRIGGGMTAVATLGSRLWWRVHPAHREFLPETATSVPFYPAPGQERPLPGYSCTESPWHLWVYIREQFGYRAGEGQEVIGFTGQPVGTGADGEPLVMPDMGVVTRYSWNDFLAELVRTPFPPTPRGPFTWLSHYATWEAVAEQLAWMDTGDPVENHIIASFGAQRAVAKTAGANGDLPEGLTFEVKEGTWRGQASGKMWLQAYVDGAKVGHLGWWSRMGPAGEAGEPGEIIDVYVGEAWRRRGIASAMFEEARKHEPRLHHSHALTDDGRAWSEKTSSKTAAYDDTLIARGLNLGVKRPLAEKIINGTVTAQDFVNALMSLTGGIGVWWGVMGTFGDLRDFEDYAWGSGDEDLTVKSAWENGDYREYPGLDGECQVVLIAKRPTRDGQPWDPEVHNPLESGGLMGNSYLADGEQIELVEVRYDAGWGWKSLPAQGIRATARKTAANGRPEGLHHYAATTGASA